MRSARPLHGVPNRSALEIWSRAAGARVVRGVSRGVVSLLPLLRARIV